MTPYRGTGPRKLLHAAAWAKRHFTGGYPVPELAVIRSFLRPTDNCLDIGAHSGSWALPLSKMVPGGTVYAFEALPYYADVLSLLVRVMRRPNISVFNYTLCDYDGFANLAVAAPNGEKLTGDIHMVGSGETASETVRSPAITLDHAAEKLPLTQTRFIKIDVEGAELAVVQGGLQYLLRDRPIIYAEVVEEYCSRYGRSSAEFFRLLDSLSYSAFLISPSLQLERLRDPQERSQQDVLFLPSESQVIVNAGL